MSAISVIHITSRKQAWAALFLPDLSANIRGQLLEYVAKEADLKEVRSILKKNWCKGCPNEQHLLATFATIIRGKNLPQDLIAVMQANPVGRTRNQLFAAILIKASTSMKVLQSEAALTDEEKETLIKRAFTVKSVAYRACYAQEVLHSWKDMPAALRALAVEYAAADPYTHCQLMILNDPESHFSRGCSHDSRGASYVLRCIEAQRVSLRQTAQEL
ncbi:MAG: hypothetical protein KGH79_03110 [Patescibacteria group bacterium]|nr:hypothetical protein [Patescibacteria group bacterium]